MTTSIYDSGPQHRGDPTSIDGAAYIAPLRALHHRVTLNIFAQAQEGLTAQLADDLAMPILGTTIQPRVTKLIGMGKLMRTGERRRNRSGVTAHVVVIVPTAGEASNDA